MKNGKILAMAALLVISTALAGCRWLASVPAYLEPGNTSNFDELNTPSAAQSNTEPTEQHTQQPTASPTQPTASPTQPPATGTATATLSADPYKVLARYETKLPDGLLMQLKYSKYTTPLDYFVALKGGSIYKAPQSSSAKLKSFSAGTKHTVIAQVLSADGKSKWYEVRYIDKKGSHTGYIKESVGKVRSFRLGMMLEQLQKLQANVDTANTVYIKNYKNRNGQPPVLANGAEVDAKGYRRSQSAPAYKDQAKTAFSYVPDGMLGSMLEKSNGMTKIFFPALGEARWVPDKYVSKQDDAIAALTQVVMVDRKYQNSAAFELIDGKWKVISMTYVSTGKTGGYSLPTPLGDFMAQEKATRFYYYKDGTKNIDGYAPHAVRFSGGGYLHGVPRKSYYTADGQRVDPPAGESLSSLGTTPQSHMCVRNYTSYAKFIYDWIKVGSGAVIVFE